MGLIGAGRWGENLLRVFSEQSDLRVCCARDKQGLATRIAGRYPNVAIVSDPDVIIGDKTLDAVVIATPMETHASLAMRALEAGKAVFVEKPMATSVDDARALVKTADASDRPLFVGHIFLYHPAWEVLEALLAIDRPAFVHTSWTRCGPFHEDLLWSFASHEVALIEEIFQAPVASVEVIHEHAGRSARDAVIARVRMRTGAEAILEIDRSHPYKRKSIAIRTEKDNGYVWEDDALMRLASGENQFTHVPCPKDEPLAREVSAFLECVDGTNRPRVDARRGLAVVEGVTKLVDAMARAIMKKERERA